jgi:NAD(P)-dependent dehydrogenase (short-subunit alcohol dehydrogenase family)
MSLLKGKVAIVTGGGGGLGESEVAVLAEAGADVAVVELDTAKARPTVEAVARSTGRRVLPFAGDISKKTDADRIAGEIADAFGGIDILVNNAAVYPKRPWTEIPEAEWDRVFAVNIKGYFLCARAVFPHMQKRGGGKIVNIASITVHGLLPELLAYVSSKGAIVGFTRALAREIGPHNITVNTIAPGAFQTDAEKIHPDPEGYSRWVIERQSLKRRGKPRDLAAAVLFFASPLSDFVTGQMLTVDGGWVMT